MKDSVTPTREAPACRPVLASASPAMRSRAAAISSWTGSAEPVTVKSARTRCCSAQSATVFSSAPVSSSCSRAAGARLCTERRASPRLWRASAAARSRWTRAVSGSRSAREVTTWSWAMIPVSPWARVSWISAASRRRSSSIPASRAWTRSWSCRAAFSAMASSSRRLVRSSSAMVSVWTRAFSSSRMPTCQKKRARVTLRTYSAPKATQFIREAGGSPPLCEPARVRAVARSPARTKRFGSRGSTSK